jgi:hypothetical protein
MVVHQMHYFSYAYIVLYIASSCDRIFGFLTAGIFVFGWVTYTSVQYILKNKKYFIYLIGGHIFLVIILATMVIIKSDIMKVALWVLTGFGGGTVFCIKEILKKYPGYNNYDLETSENYGHIVGVVFSIVTFMIFKNINAPIISSAIFAGATVLLASNLWVNDNKEEHLQ